MSNTKTTHLFNVSYNATAELTQAELVKASAAITTITDTCDIVTTAALDKDLSWSCSYKMGELVIPKALDLESVYIAMHECGHFAKKHARAEYTSRKEMNKHTLIKENEANAFALEMFKTITTNPEAIATVETIIAKQIKNYEDGFKAQDKHVAEMEEMREEMMKKMKHCENIPNVIFGRPATINTKTLMKQARKENLKTMVFSALAGVGAAHIVFAVLTAII